MLVKIEKDGTYTIKGNLFDKPVKSSTGKTMLVTSGRTQVANDGKVVTFAVNAHYKP